MRVANRVLLGLAVVLTAIPPVGAQSLDAFTAANLRDACDNLVMAVRGINPISQDDPGAMLCLGFIAGWTQAMERHPEKSFCLPSVEESLPGDLADLVVSYVDGHPDRSDAPAHEVLIESFEGAFPCDDQENAESAEGGQP